MSRAYFPRNSVGLDDIIPHSYSENETLRKGNELCFNAFNKFLPISCIFLENRRLRDEYAFLQGRMKEVYRELRDTKDELNVIRKDNYKLHTYNQELSHENNDLWGKIKHYQLQDDTDADDKSDSNGDDPHLERNKRIKWHKIKVQEHDNDKLNDENARVRYNLRFIQSVFFLLSFFCN